MARPRQEPPRRIKLDWVTSRSGEAFRRDMAALAAAGEWRSWDVTRLVYADWFDQEVGCPLLAAVTRAHWRAGKTSRRAGGAALEHWHVTTRGGLSLASLGGRVRELGKSRNGFPLLHFPVGTFKVLLEVPPEWDVVPACLTCTYMPQRLSRAIYDLGLHPDGFAALFPLPEE